MAAKPAGIDIERNYVTVTLCIRKTTYMKLCVKQVWRHLAWIGLLLAVFIYLFIYLSF